MKATFIDTQKGAVPYRLKHDFSISNAIYRSSLDSMPQSSSIVEEKADDSLKAANWQGLFHNGHVSVI